MKKYKLITACLLILLAFLLFNIFNRNGNSTIETFNADAATKKEITDELVIALFIEDITNVVTNFYSEYYSGETAVYNYEITIVYTRRQKSLIITETRILAGKTRYYQAKVDTRRQNPYTNTETACIITETDREFS